MARHFNRNGDLFSMDSIVGVDWARTRPGQVVPVYTIGQRDPVDYVPTRTDEIVFNVFADLILSLEQLSPRLARDVRHRVTDMIRECRVEVLGVDSILSFSDGREIRIVFKVRSTIYMSEPYTIARAFYLD